jgi:DNA mismatch repair protein MutL
MPIRLLGPDVAAKIAAGEVIERPSSVVKELVENALDAGASQIEVELRGGGLTLVRITDDGAGIPADELALAVRRHATSKLETADQLWRIETLGFRGEALASVAAVARLTLISRPPDTGAAAYIAVAGEDLIEQGQQGAPVGTTVFVRDLFKTVPARLAFLRSGAAENARSTQVVTHYALAYPEVAFRLLVDGRLAFHSPGSGDRRDVLMELWGPDTVSALHEIEATQVGGATVTGFAGPPDLLRSRRDAQIAFVNRRWVDARVLSYAIADAYRDLVPRGRHPVAVLFVQVPPVDVDVNVHPAKAEVRFRREGEVFAAVQRAIRRTLATHSLLPLSEAPTGAGMSTPTIPSAPTGSDIALEAPPLFADEEPAPVAVSKQRLAGGGPRPQPTRLVLRPVGQVGTTYIVAEGPDGMYLVDQHAAHERLVFDQLLAVRSERPASAQGLLDPLAVALTRPQAQALDDLCDLLAAYGFQWEPFGEDAILLRAVPASLREGEAAQTLLEVLDEDRSRDLLLPEGGQDNASDALHLRERRIAASIACHSTVRAGQVLTLPEMDALLHQFEAAHFPRLCPHGRPTMVHLSSAQLEKQFGRR